MPPLMNDEQSLHLYRRLRADLLRGAENHRRAARRDTPTAAMDRLYLRDMRRQMRELREAYRVTRARGAIAVVRRGPVARAA